MEGIGVMAVLVLLMIAVTLGFIWDKLDAIRKLLEKKERGE